MLVQDHAAIVTGGGSGLGAETARALSSGGAKVAIFDRNLEAAKRVADEIGARAFRCDVADAESAESAVTQARHSHGAARILVNCAGIAPAARIVGRHGAMPLQDFRKVIEVNLIGSFNMLRLMAADLQQLDPLEDGERGVAISTASVAAYEGQIGQAAYAASKAGIVGLTLPAAREFSSSGIRVCAIAPGIFETPMLHGLPQSVQASLGASVPFPSRLGRASEYAKLVLHIIDNVMLNGEVIRLDGAIRLAPK